MCRVISAISLLLPCVAQANENEWLIGLWRVDRASLEAELKRAREWDHEKLLGFIALSEAAVAAEFSYSADKSEIRNTHQVGPSTKLHVEPQQDGSVSVGLSSAENVRIYRGEGGVFASANYSGELVTVKLQRVNINTEKPLLPSWIQGNWALNKVETANEYAKRPKGGEAPMILSYLNDKQSNGSIDISGNKLTVRLFDGVDTWQAASARTSDERLDVEDTNGQLHRFYTTPNKDRIIMRMSKAEPGMIFDRAGPQSDVKR